MHEKKDFSISVKKRKKKVLKKEQFQLSRARSAFICAWLYDLKKWMDLKLVAKKKDFLLRASPQEKISIEIENHYNVFFLQALVLINRAKVAF